MISGFMNILRALIITTIGFILLLTLWPLFIFLLVVIVLYWIYFKNKIVNLQREATTTQQQSPTQESNKDVIEAEYTERRE
jgi:low temperature requirement protein LtrA